MRIVIAGINHETNTYCLEQTVASDFHQSRGERIFRSLGTETSIGGALETCAELGIETGIDLEALVEAGRLAERILDRRLPSAVLRGGTLARFRAQAA